MSLARTAPLKLHTPFREAVGIAAVQVAAVSCHGAMVRAICPGQTIYVGKDDTVTAANGFPMADGDTLDLQLGNTSTVWVIASAADQALAVLPYAL
jgi:hypothetical protein